MNDTHTGVVVNQAITGMGGLGKTQLAVEFAYRFGSYFRGVHWLNLADPSQLDAEIARCGLQMSLPHWTEDQPSQVVLTLNTWKADGPRLLVLDNFEAVEQINKVLPRLRHSNLRLLLTSRRKDWTPGSGLHALPLDVFTVEEGTAFLKNALAERKEKEQDLKALAERLGYLPLALELASRYVNDHPRLSLTDYLVQSKQAFEHPSMKDWRKDLPAPTEHDLDLQHTFALSWQSVKNEIAQKIFMMAGYLAPNTPVPPEIFERALEVSTVVCDENLSILYGLGLLHLTEINQPAMHPLLAEYGRGLAKEDKKILESLAKALANIADRENDTGLPSSFVPLRPHMPILATYAEDSTSVSAGALWNNYGYHLGIIADYAGRRVAYERALKISETTFGSDHPNVATGVNNLGSVLQDLGDLEGARSAYNRALKISEATFGSDHPEVAIYVNNLGNVLRELGDLPGARAAYERALMIDEAALGFNHPNVATRVNNLGDALRELGDLDGARASFERALKIDETSFGPDHPTVARDVNNLGDTLRELGDLPGARVAIERALRIVEAAFGFDHPKVAICVNNLGNVLHELGDLDGAWASFERALKIDETSFGPDHPNVAIDVNNLGSVQRDLGDLPGARVAYQRALKIFKKFLPPDHPNIKTVQGNLESLGE